MCAVPNIAAFFCTSLISCFPGMLPRYGLSEFEIIVIIIIIISSSSSSSSSIML